MKHETGNKLEGDHAFGNLVNDMGDICALEKEKIFATAHLTGTEGISGFDAHHLTQEDAEIWDQWKNGTLDDVQITQRREAVRAAIAAAGSLEGYPELASQKDFVAFMGNLKMLDYAPSGSQREQWLASFEAARKKLGRQKGGV